MSPKLESKHFIYSFLLIYFLIGLTIYKDYGVGIEEHFQRQNGFYWLSHFLSFTNFDDLKIAADIKYQNILINNPNLPNSNFFKFYGIAFDLPLAFIEIFFNINTSRLYFEIRHLFSFLVFFISSIFFYKIIKRRFSNNIIIFLGIFFFIFTPRIFGDSFHNNKDILFLSFLTIAIYYLFKLFSKATNKNLILFCLFSALATSSRIMGIYLPIMLILFYFFEFLVEELNLKTFFFKSFKVLIIFYLFLLLHYPYAWEFSLLKTGLWFKNFFYWMDIEILFNGNYYPIKYLPRSYLPIWIFISTPFIILIFFFIGSSIIGNIIFKRILKIENKLDNNKKDLWITINDKKNLFIFISFFSFFTYAIFLNVAMLSGWRHFYFLHIFIVYLSLVGANSVYGYLIKKFNLKITFIITFLISIYFLYTNYKFHPFQSLYFSKMINSKNIKRFQIDTPNLSRSHALKYIINLEDGNNKKIYIANASWTPMYNGKDMLSENNQKKLVFVGQNFNKANYIYTNYVFKSDERYNKNYKIPVNFKKMYDFQIDNVLIYTIYKRED